jgi:protein involved in polysaccharide export with SLBB domain
LGALPEAGAQAARGGEDKVQVWQERNQNIRDAQKALATKSATTGQIQRQIDKLNEKKTQIEKEIDYTTAKFNAASRSYQASLKAGSPEEIDRWNREATAWDNRLKSAQADLAKVDEDIKQKIKEFQEAITGGKIENIIVPGDALQLFVLEDETYNGLYQVRRGGYVILPRVGRVFLAGKDMAAAEKTIKDALEASQLRQGTVMLERARGAMEEEAGEIIYLAGEFTTPGPLRVPPGVEPTMVTTILRSGGVTKSADLQHVKLLRLENGQGLVEEVNVQAILDGSGLPSDLSLNAGDIIVVPAFAPVIYVTGNVQRPIQLTLSNEEDLTAYSAILRCGGFARFAKITGVYVMRDHGNGEKSRIPVNIKNVQAGKEPDVVLRGKDIVVVPEKFFSW